MDAALKSRIETMLAQNPVLLFMKGMPEAPMCGFSARAVQILNMVGAPYAAYNILDDDELRQGLKDYADWPTYPQLYINGELVGGVDIMTAMYNEGELHEALGKPLPAAE
ncbi:MAG: Grx4 family monothiol glutaredoxin [Pseudomonadaceae bacterium]|nr:Grx4 family monothiol glutaredoxin [Pseudomonadaceae bacterium]